MKFQYRYYLMSFDEKVCGFGLNIDVDFPDVEIIKINEKKEIVSKEYKKISKDTMDKVIWLRSETDLELFLGMDDYLQESVAIKIAEKLNANERIDYNYLRTIKDKTGIDIEAIAQDLKDRNRKPTDEE